MNTDRSDVIFKKPKESVQVQASSDAKMMVMNRTLTKKDDSISATLSSDFSQTLGLEYLLEVNSEIKSGVEVLALAGSFCYLLERIDISGDPKNGWKFAGRMYFPNELSANNYVRLSLYEEALYAIEEYSKYVDTREESQGEWNEEDQVTLAFILGGESQQLDIWYERAVEIAHDGRSEKLFQWFLTSSREDLLAWNSYSANWALMQKNTRRDNEVFFPKYRYRVEKRCLRPSSLELFSDFSGVYEAIIPILEKALFQSKESHPHEESSELREALEVAITLGAEIASVPGTSAFGLEGEYYSQGQGR